MQETTSPTLHQVTTMGRRQRTTHLATSVVIVAAVTVMMTVAATVIAVVGGIPAATVTATVIATVIAAPVAVVGEKHLPIKREKGRARGRR